MKKPVAFLLFFSHLTLCALDWPVAEPTLTATFGEYRGDHFHAGLDLGGREQAVTPIAVGEKVFAYEEGEDFSSLPRGFGNFLVLQHEGGIRSLYAHLKEGSMEGEKTSYARGDRIGLMGATGYSQGRHLHLSIIDAETNTLVNPLVLLTPLRDSQSPAVRRMYLKKGDTLTEVRSGQSVSAGQVEVVSELFDLREDIAFVWKLAPYKIALYQDGREISTLVLDSLKQKNAQLVLGESERPFQKVYEGEWLYRLATVQLAGGKTSLVVFVQDFAGNEASREVTLRVE